MSLDRVFLADGADSSLDCDGSPRSLAVDGLSRMEELIVPRVASVKLVSIVFIVFIVCMERSVFPKARALASVEKSIPSSRGSSSV